MTRIIANSELSKPITIIPPLATPFTSKARQVMQQVGLFELTQDKTSITTSREDVIYWRLAKGATQSGTELEILETIAEKVNEPQKERVKTAGLWRDVSEAVNNAHEHAYKFTREDGFTGLADTKWWLLTQIRDNMFTAAACDLGCGYAKTLKPEISGWFKGLPSQIFGDSNRDTLAMQAAMSYGRSSTRKEERGRGSKDALDFLEKHGNGTLYLLSNRGCLQYSCRNGSTKLDSASSLDFDIQGTIIWWNLNLGETT